MILVKTKADSLGSSPLGLSNAKDEKSTLSFSQLLHGAKEGSKDEKELQKGSFVVSLGSSDKEVKEVNLKKLTTDMADFKELKTSIVNGQDMKLADEKGKDLKAPSKGETLSSLLKGKEKLPSLVGENIELNPVLTQNLTQAELKTLIADAKKFLKEKILESVEYKKSELKDLPQTLKGLVQVAKKFGIDVSKITLEEIKNTPNELKPLVQSTSSMQVDEKKEVPKTQNNQAPVKEEKQTSELKEAKKAEQDLDAIDSEKIKTPKAKVVKIQTEGENSTELKAKSEQREISKVEESKIQATTKEVKATPLFKAMEKVDYATEQLVQTRQLKMEEKTPKSRADETLKLLLQGEKPSNAGLQLGLTKDFSVATARVIAPSATTESTKSLEQLLHGEVTETSAKTEGLSTTHKADSFEVKFNEAKQMMKYLSADIKNAIEDYKPPFTRIKVQLNPQKMGEVDLTVIQRGKNLHVNLSSNNAAINTLSMNMNELKVQLTNSGIQNATLNFSNGNQSGEQSQGQQQNRQNERRANEEYTYYDNEEQNEEILSSLEIIVPNYV